MYSYDYSFFLCVMSDKQQHYYYYFLCVCKMNGHGMQQSKHRLLNFITSLVTTSQREFRFAGD